MTKCLKCVAGGALVGVVASATLAFSHFTMQGLDTIVTYFYGEPLPWLSVGLFFICLGIVAGSLICGVGRLTTHPREDAR